MSQVQYDDGSWSREMTDEKQAVCDGSFICDATLHAHDCFAKILESTP